MLRSMKKKKYKVFAAGPCHNFTLVDPAIGARYHTFYLTNTIVLQAHGAML